MPHRVIVGVRFEARHVRLLRQVCNARGEDLSDFVRRAVKVELARLSFLDELEKKALGVSNRQQAPAHQLRGTEDVGERA